MSAFTNTRRSETLRRPDKVFLTPDLYIEEPDFFEPQLEIPVLETTVSFSISVLRTWFSDFSLNPVRV
jgi:hypothetical protein